MIQHLSEMVYTPESRIRHPLRLFKEIWRDLLGSRDLAWRLMVRDIKALYRQSLLGIFWAVIPPIVTAIGLTLANSAKVINIGMTDLPYPAYVMFSIVLWRTFVETLFGQISGLMNAKAMLTKIKFPPESLILSQLGQQLFNFAIKLVLIIGMFIWFRVTVTWTVILAPFALLFLVMLGTSLGLLLAPIAVLYQDIPRTLTLMTTAWLFLTPVIYPVPQTGVFGTVVRLNPVTPLLVTTRELATTGEVSQPLGFFVISGITLVGLLLTWMVYRLAMPIIIERMSA